MRKKLPIFILALIILLQACFPAVYASSKNEATGSYASFCSFDTTSKGAGKAELGRKLEYVFGKATGSEHNIERSVDMERQLNRIGIFDNAKGRGIVQEHLSDAFKNTTNGTLQENGRMLKESLLTGPNGVVKVQSVWEGNKLITVEMFGGGK